MTRRESERLKEGDRVCWGDDADDAGTVIETGYAAVKVKWDHIESAGVGPEGIGIIAHEDMKQIHRCPTLRELAASANY